MKIAVSGKGGTGKTTIAGTLARILSDKGYSVIAVDADPSMNLHTSIGMKSPEPIAELKALIAERAVISPGVYNLNPNVEDVIEKYSLQKENIRLVVMGTVEKGGSGCICPENAFLRALMRHIVLRRNEFLILDAEAGVEHLGRKTAEGFDLMLVLCEPSVKAAETANRIYELSRQIGIMQICAVGNKVASAEDENFVRKHLKFETIKFIPFDRSVVESDVKGVAIIDLNKSSPCIRAIGELAEEIEKKGKKVPSL